MAQRLRCLPVLFVLFLSLSLNDARKAFTTHRKVVNPFAESTCVVKDWEQCIMTCPTNSTLPAVMLGKQGATVGKFIPVPVQEYESTSIEGCCKACTNFNDVHWNNIFGFVCDYWSWEQKQGFLGRCALYDYKTVCGSVPAEAKQLFNASKTNTVSFPALCS